MKPLKLVFVATLVAGVVGLGAVTMAQKKAKAAAPKKKPDRSVAAGLDTVELAHQLASWGRTNRNPAALAVASQVLASTTTKSLKAKLETKNKKKKKVRSGASQPALTKAKLVGEAKKLCGKDKKKLAALDTVLAMGVRAKGPVEPYAVTARAVNPGNLDIFTVTFRGGEYGYVGVKGDPGSLLMLHVVYAGPNGAEDLRMACKDEYPSSVKYCEWYANQTRPYAITVTNVGDSPTGYLIGVK